MTGRELRKQRREAERKARKLEYRQNRLAAAATAPAPKMCGAGSLAGKPVAEPALSVALPPTAKSSPTGPRSPEGKSISSGNSLKHGLASGRIIIAGEDPNAFEALLAGLNAEHASATETEMLLVKQMAQSWWLMQRAIRFQNEAFAGTDIDNHKLALFLRYQTTHERAFYKAMSALTQLKRNRAREQAGFRIDESGERKQAASEFVSQNRRPTREAQEFVSQNAGLSADVAPSGEAEFVNPPLAHLNAA